MENKRTMQVQGRGRATAEPDTVTISFRADNVSEDYSAAIDGVNLKVEQLRRKLESAGISRDSLRTSNFSVQSNFNRDRSYIDFFGYKAGHDLILELPFNRDVLNRVFSSITSSASEAKFSITFGVHDKDALRKRSLEHAVNAAKQNATTLAKAADVKLGSILDIQYGWSEVRFRSYDVAARSAIELDDAAPPDVNPDEVSHTENVTVMWEME